VFGALNWLTESTERLTASVEQMRPEDLAQPSHLPGWSRAHVLVHLSRNADGLRNLLLSARTGEPLRMYPSPGAREADIIAGVARPADVVLADAVEASRRFLVEAHSFAESRWPNEVAFSSGGPNPPLVSAERIVELRLTEVEIHHVDLDLVYSFADMPVHVAVSCSSTSSNATTARALTLLLSLTTVPEAPVGSRVGISPSCAAPSPQLWRG
jgi:maleylpyruvate isomerase